MRSGAANHRGASRQDYETPWELIRVVESRFGQLAVDLAASESNTKASRFISERDDSLSVAWHLLSKDLLWLNPPFGNIAPWARKCAIQANYGARIAFLVPASVGANWYRDHVHGKARVYFLNGRICFDGKNGFPKDCLLALYGEPAGYEVWTWKPRKAEEQSLFGEVGT